MPILGPISVHFRSILAKSGLIFEYLNIGWHKRYFILDNGFLSYGKNASELSRGRTHGKIDVGLALISTKTELFRIDLDDEHSIHHLKASEIETYGLWIEQLQQGYFTHKLPDSI